jgi:hypothetical protein
MPTKRRFLLFLIVLAVMLLIKYAAGQEEATVGWDSITTGPDALAYGIAAIYGGMFWGVLSGIIRVADRNHAAREGRYFSGDLVVLRIRN